MVFGIPIENEHEPLIITTEFPKLDGDSFNQMVGGCKYKDLTYRLYKYERRFYLSFRTDKTTSCRYERFAFISSCYSCFQSISLLHKILLTLLPSLVRLELPLWKIILPRSLLISLILFGLSKSCKNDAILHCLGYRKNYKS